MIGYRARRWIGTHPVWAVNLLTVFWLLAGAAGLFLAVYALERAGVRSDGLEALVGFGSAALVWLAVVLSTMGVALVLGRAGMRPANVLGGLKYVPLILALLPLVPYAIYWIVMAVHAPFSEPRPLWEWVAPSVASVASGTIPLMLAQTAGWGLAALIVRARTRSGNWETTRPAGKVRRASVLSVRHPVLATASLAGFLFAVWAHVLVYTDVFGDLDRVIVPLLAWSLPWPSLFVGLYALMLTLRLREIGRPARAVALSAAIVAALVVVETLVLGLLWDWAYLHVRLHWSWFSAAAVVGGLAAGAAVLGGSGLGQWIARRRIRSGRWDPPAAEGEDEPA